MAGASSGAILLVRLRIAQPLRPEQRIARLFANGGECYVHTLYTDEWMAARHFATAISLDERA